MLVHRWRKRLCTKQAKLLDQAAYVVWRQDVEAPSQPDPQLRGKRVGVSELKSPLPAADPGVMLVHRWRKRGPSARGALT